MMTEDEKTLFRMLYRSQIALAKADLARRNAMPAVTEEGAWPAGQQWHELNGSSHAILFRAARDIACIDHDEYLRFLREDNDALEIAEEELAAADLETP